MPYFGVPIRNGVPIGLGSIAGFGISPFDPSQLFAGGEQGGWYDPSDLTTMFQDAAGTTAAALEQPVGLVLDKSKGGRQSLAVTGWVKNSGDGTVTVDGNTITITGATTVTRVDVNAPGWAVGDYADITLTSTVSGATGAAVYVGAGAPYNLTTGTSTYRNVITSSALLRLQISTGTATFVVTSRGYVPGNHLSQSTSTARPVLSARVNLLTYTEQFDNAAWAALAVTIPLPTKVSADEVSFPAVTGAGDASVVGQSFVSVATTYQGSVDVKAKTSGDIGKKIAVYINDGSVVNYTFHTLTADWVRISVTENTSATATCYFMIGVLGSSWGGGNQAACSINIRRADLRPANAGVGLPPYQRVGAATDYDTTGFPYYLRFDGTDDFLVSGTIDPGSVDKAQVFAGVRKLSDASPQMFCEYSASIGSNTGSLALNQGDFTNGTGAYWIHGARGAAALASNQFATTPANYAAPITSVLAGYSDISGDLSVIRVNGTEQATATGDKGSGNWGSYPLYIGRRGGTSQPFSGSLYSLILRFSATNMDAATISSTETWVNQKTLAY